MVPLPDRGMAARVAESPLRPAVDQLQEAVGNAHLVSPAPGGVVTQIIVRRQPAVIFHGDAAAGMEKGVVAKLMAKGRDRAPRIRVIREAAMRIHIEGGGQALRGQEGRNDLVVHGERIVICQRDGTPLPLRPVETTGDCHGEPFPVSGRTVFIR